MTDFFHPIRALSTCLVCWVIAAVLPVWATEYDDSLIPMITHDDSRLLIENVRMVDGTGSAALERVSVLIDSGRIVDIAPSGTIPSDAATVIDGVGKTLLPGYVMLHEHLFYLNPVAPKWNYTTEHLLMPPLYLAAGATTVRTGGTFDADEDLRTKSLVESGQLAGPDIFVTAPFIEGPGSFAYQMRPMEDADEVRQFVRYWVKAGATSFKAYMNIAPDVLGAAIDEAHSLGAHVTGHLCSVTFEEAADLGIDDLEHGLTEASDLAKEKQPGVCPTVPAEERVALMALENPDVQSVIDTLVNNNVTITSTLPVFAAGLHPAIPTRASLELLSPRSRIVAQDRWNRYLHPDRRARTDIQLAELRREMAFEKAFVEAGGNLVVGTDPTGWGGTLPPNSTHAALILLVEAGFTPLEAISLATLNGARFLGVSEDVGSIAVGKRANLILIDGEPDQNIRDVQNVELVFKDGTAFDPEALLASVRGKLGR